MCLLAVLFRVVDDAPVVVGANREEAFSRGGTEPDLRGHFVAGLDPVAGGTWFGVNDSGVLVAVTNRPKWPAPESPRSRGLLVRDLLAAGSAREAHDMALRELQARPYAGCNLLCADAADAFVIHAAEWLRVLPLPPGAHVLTGGDVNRPGDVRSDFVLHHLRGRRFDDGSDAVAELRRICSHAGPPVPVVKRDAEGGTVSSTLVALRSPLRASEMHHAQGPPDRVPYQDRSDLFARLSQRPKE